MKKPFENVSVIGAGTLGAQIALLSINAGYQVTVCDQIPDAFSKMVSKLLVDLKAKMVEPFIPYEKWGEYLRQANQVTDLGAAVKEADLIIEVIPEILELKRSLFVELGEKAPPHAILGTNSSSLPVSKMEDASGRPEQCLNLHFYMPLQGMNIADVMGGSRTTQEVMEKGTSWIRSLGCIPLTVNKELFGFCFNRVWRAVKREVLYMWGNGFVDFRDIDRAWMKFTGRDDRPGPFGLMDNIGLDVIHDIEMVYFEDSKDPRDYPPATLKEKIEKGELGVKTGKGFYSYPNPEYLQDDFLLP